MLKKLNMRDGVYEALVNTISAISSVVDQMLVQD